MAKKRTGDPVAKNWYRSDRFSETGGKWYFFTREGTIEGPFESKLDATCRLETYIKVASSGVISGDHGFALSA